MTEYTDQDFQAGSDCPLCGDPIYMTWTDMLRDPDENVRDANCWLPVEEVEPTGPVEEFAGNTYIIDHIGPSHEG